MSDELEKHVLRKYDIQQKLGKGVRSAVSVVVGGVGKEYTGGVATRIARAVKTPSVTHALALPPNRHTELYGKQLTNGLVGPLP